MQEVRKIDTYIKLTINFFDHNRIDFQFYMLLRKKSIKSTL